MSAPDVVVTVAVEELLLVVGSVVSELTVAVLARDDPVRDGSILMTSVNVSSAPPGSEARAHDTVPLLPVAGDVQLHAAGEASDTNVVPEGSVSVSLALAASLGPALVTWMV